jgi:hypothetical protein
MLVYAVDVQGAKHTYLQLADCPHHDFSARIRPFTYLELSLNRLLNERKAKIASRLRNEFAELPVQLQVGSTE